LVSGVVEIFLSRLTRRLRPAGGEQEDGGGGDDGGSHRRCPVVEPAQQISCPRVAAPARGPPRVNGSGDNINFDHGLAALPARGIAAGSGRFARDFPELGIVEIVVPRTSRGSPAISNFPQEKTMSGASRGSILAVLAALALAGCNDRGANNQANVAAPPDMASDTGMNTADTTMAPGPSMTNDTGMNASSTIDMNNASTGSKVTTSTSTTTSNTTGY
jgi:hypothetical protein